MLGRVLKMLLNWQNSLTLTAGSQLLFCLMLPSTSAEWTTWTRIICAILGIIACTSALMLMAGLFLDLRQNWRQHVQIKRQRNGQCVRCGYALQGLPERRCPECGNPF